MTIMERITARQDELTGWRRHLHAHPEIAYEEHATSAFVADQLAALGIEVHRGLAGTGVVGTIRRGEGGAIALRADMDALPLTEQNGFDHCSTIAGRMHGCGHDGHTTMLLGAARHILESDRWRGTVHLIFQPAEEGLAGGRRMIEDGLFDLFPVDMVFGMHNWPGIPAGQFAIRPGPLLAASDTWQIIVRGKGGHAAMPHTVSDPIVAAAAIVGGLQTIVSRNLHPVDSGVVSVTQFHAGDADNVIPAEVLMRGTARSFLPETRDTIEAGIRRVAAGAALQYDTEAEVMYDRRYPPTINAPEATRIAAGVAAAIVGEDKVDRDVVPTMGGEDFAFMLEQRPGAYILIGNGPGEDGRVLHSPRYDFNDAILPLGATYWVRLAETVLAA